MITYILHSHISLVYNRYYIFFVVEDVIEWNIRFSLSTDFNENIVAINGLSVELQERAII